MAAGTPWKRGELAPGTFPVRRPSALTRRENRLYGLHPSAPDYSFPSPMALELTRAE
jgi:hypothetical protein